MTASTLHPLAADYLQRLRRAGRGLPRGRLAELVAEIEGHLSEALDAKASDAEVLTVLDKLGEPEAIIEAEAPYRDPRMGRDHPAPVRRLHLRVRVARRTDPSLELARMDQPRQMDRHSDHPRRARDHDLRRAGGPRQIGPDLLRRQPRRPPVPQLRQGRRRASAAHLRTKQRRQHPPDRGHRDPRTGTLRQRDLPGPTRQVDAGVGARPRKTAPAR
jgi:hypothetical protein